MKIDCEEVRRNLERLKAWCEVEQMRAEYILRHTDNKDIEIENCAVIDILTPVIVRIDTLLMRLEDKAKEEE